MDSRTILIMLCFFVLGSACTTCGKKKKFCVLVRALVV